MILFKKRRQRSLFKKAFVEAALQKFKEGEIDHDTLKKCLKAAKSPKLEEARKKLMDTPMWGGIRDWDWESIRKWFVDYFIPAMKIILPIALMLLKPNSDE